MLTKKTLLQRLSQLAMIATGLGTLALMAVAQDFPMHSGNPNRTGLPVDVNAGAFPPDTYNDIGRGFLRWWDPVRSLSSVIDTDDATLFGTATGNPLGSWVDATLSRTVAFNYVQSVLGKPIYRYSTLVKGTNPNNRIAGQTASYSFTFSGLTPGQGYELYVNMPIGPTDASVNDFRYPQKYWVVQVTGATGGAHIDTVDYDLHAGGYVRLGNDGNTTNTLFSPTATNLVVTIYNVAPIGENGRFLDPNLDNDPTLLARQVIYADAAQIVSLSKTGKASYTAAPVVGRLNAPRPQGGAEPYRWRTVAARNEVGVVGELNQTFNLGILTSYDFRGQSILSTQNGRLNKIFSWPVKRPFDNSDLEATNFGIAKRDWIMAAGKNRAVQETVVDNLSGGASATAGFVTFPAGPNTIGPNYLEAFSTGGPTTQQATFGAQIPEGNYFVDVHLPGIAGAAKDVEVDVLLGGATVDSLSLDMNGAAGWVRVPFQSNTGYKNSAIAPISVIITNHTGTVSEAGKPIQADAVRFVRQADLSIDSTPVQVTATINVLGVPTQRDVIIAAMENGRIYCIDAHGDPVTGGPSPIYWTYPTEGATDPNNDPAEDGKDRIAEMPSGFDLSSAMVQNVGGNDYLYIASQNGKVYCIDMLGRGDGTTRRRWTYPDDYDPSLGNQDLPMKPGLRPIVGSLAFGTATGNVPIVIVPTQEGRIIALDALGNNTTKKTTPVWQYPLATDPTLGPVESTPVVAFGKVFFTATTTQLSTLGSVYAVNEGDGTLSWTQDASTAQAFSKFGQSSPVAVPRAMLPITFGQNWDIAQANDMDADRVFVCDDSGNFASLDPANGALVWNTTEIVSGSVGPLRFSYTTSYDNSAALRQNVPTVFVTSINGEITGLHAFGWRNKALGHKIWGYRTEGQPQISTTANGGYVNLVASPHSWMYIGDSEGFFYAFNSVDDTNPFVITPGDPPGQQTEVINEPGQDELNAAIDPDKYLLLSPQAFDQIRELADTGTVTQAQVQAVVASDRIDRRHYEYGETLYILIYDLPALTGLNANYYVEIEASSAGRPTQRRQIPTRSYSGGGGNYLLSGVPLMTTGIGGVGPGANFLTAKAVAPSNRGIQGQVVHLKRPATFVPPVNCDFYLANPLGLAFLDNVGTVSQSVCLNNLANTNPTIITDPNDPRWVLYNANGNAATDQFPSGPPVEPAGPFGPDLKSKGEAVSHGSSGVQQLYVADRSLMVMLTGRGINGVRVGSRDIAWVKDTADLLTGGVYKPLSANGVSYPRFEDYPVFVPNTSLDYPDVGREGLSVTANLFGQAQNPLYLSGIEATAPSYAQTDLQAYRAKAGYEAQMARRLNMTVFDMTMNVPKFQPPSNKGYYGSQSLFVDSQSGAFSNSTGTDPFRTFGLGLGVGIDEHLAITTPTIDLGSLPSGGAYNGGVGFGPRNPWDPTSLFSPWNASFSNLYQAFGIENDGNVNLLNVRTAKYFNDAKGNRPVELYMPGQHELAWLDASRHLHTSLDRRYSSSLLVGSGPGFDAQGRNILQKPRPRDIVGTRLNVNPRSRPNANLKTAGGYLFDPLVIKAGDPKIGVSAPIGAPAGEYLRKIFVFENSNTANDFNIDNPSLGTDEPYSDPSANLKFVVREGRLTNSMTVKSAPMVDNLLTGTENFAWQNTQPTAMRDGLGNLFMAWASNRVDAGNTPAWNAKAKSGNDLLVQDKWRIYVGSLRSILGNAVGESPIADLNAWANDTNNRWFKQALIIDPPVTLFDVNTANGESLDVNSVKFGSPSFPTSGFFSLLEFPSAHGRLWQTGRYLTFIGEATKYDSAGTAVQLSQIFLVPLTCNGDGTISYNPAQISTSPFDSTSQKSRLSLIHQRNGNVDYASIYSTSFSNGQGQIVWNTYDSNVWRQGNLRMGSAFETMGAPSAVLRRYQNQNNAARVDLTFTAKLKGRRFSEAYLARLNVNNRTGFPQGRNSLAPFGTSTAPWTDEITADTSTGVFWTPGIQWLTDQASMDQVDVGTDDSGSVAASIWDQNVSTRTFDATSGVLKFNSKFGGEVLIDSNNGSIRLNGAILKRSTRLFVRYRPTMMRISQGDGANYRSISSAFDDRFVGIRVNGANPQRNLRGDLQNWMGEVNPPIEIDLIRWDRTVVAYTRTSGDGTASARPFLQTLRPGVQLKYGIRTNESGVATFFKVNNFGGAIASERYAQYDPATGRVFFMSGCEDREVTITYDAVDDAGNFVGQVTEGGGNTKLVVRLIPEINEQAVPIEQVGNESALTICLDPLNGTFNDINPQSGRRPGLLWLFWASARTGQSDIYFETIAPRFAPKRGKQ